MTDEALLDANQESLICAAFKEHNTLGLAVMEVSSGRFEVLQTEQEDHFKSELARLNPAELLIPDNPSLANAVFGLKGTKTSTHLGI